jgi:serine/threonine protein kinase
MAVWSCFGLLVTGLLLTCVLLFLTRARMRRDKVFSVLVLVVVFGLAGTVLAGMAGSEAGGRNLALIAVIAGLGFPLAWLVSSVVKGRERPQTWPADQRRFCPTCGNALPANAPHGICPRCLLGQGLDSPLVAAARPSPLGTSPYQGPFVPPSPAELAAHFPQLEILRLLGQGGMGAVYMARQKKLDRLVALKILPSESARDPAFAERFQREARALARLNHPNIVAVHDFGESGELFYFIMEYVDGVNLRQVLQTGKLPPDNAIRIIPQLCDALQYAHDEEIVHRDIKPENILLDQRGRVKIADFGLAKILRPAAPSYTLTGSQQIMGTPHYMAPEQMEKPSSVDHRADIYSLGVVFYEMLTGELPLGRFALPSEKTPVDGRLDEIVLRTLEKDRDRRYQRASEVKTAMEAAAGAPALTVAAVPLVRSFQEEIDLEMRRLQLLGPATGLIVVALLSIVHWTIPLIKTLVDGWDWQGLDQQHPWAGVGILELMFVLSASLLLLGSRKMMRFERYEFVVFACVWAMLPWSGLVVILGAPIGIWALRTVLRPDVKLAFVRKKVRARFSGERPALVMEPSRGKLRSVLGAVGSLFLGSRVSRPFAAALASAPVPTMAAVPGAATPLTEAQPASQRAAVALANPAQTAFKPPVQSKRRAPTWLVFLVVLLAIAGVLVLLAMGWWSIMDQAPMKPDREPYQGIESHR